MPSTVSRRDVLRAGGAPSLCAVSGCLSAGGDEAASEAGDDPSWRSFGHDAANANYAPDGTAPTEFARSTPRRATSRGNANSTAASTGRRRSGSAEGAESRIYALE